MISQQIFRLDCNVLLRNMTEIDVKTNLQTVLKKIEAACERRPPELQYAQPRLVAVGKTKPVDQIVAAYEAGQRHFGENYVQELEEKALSPIILEKCDGIKWHFIGHLQSNKVNRVLALPNIHIIETVHSEKLAATLNKSWSKFGAPGSKLNVFVQVNASRETEKSGVPPTDVVALTKYVLNQCPNLNLEGLMTIGKYGYNPEEGQNPDYVVLKKCRDEVCQILGINWKTLNLSMGMSSDYEHAIEMGSTNVRVGTSIFGDRVVKQNQ